MAVSAYIYRCERRPNEKYEQNRNLAARIGTIKLRRSVQTLQHWAVNYSKDFIQYGRELNNRLSNLVKKPQPIIKFAIWSLIALFATGFTTCKKEPWEMAWEYEKIVNYTVKISVGSKRALLYKHEFLITILNWVKGIAPTLFFRIIEWINN